MNEAWTPEVLCNIIWESVSIQDNTEMEMILDLQPISRYLQNIM
jgi:hypothetical protein